MAARGLLETNPLAAIKAGVIRSRPTNRNAGEEKSADDTGSLRNNSISQTTSIFCGPRCAPLQSSLRLGSRRAEGAQGSADAGFHGNPRRLNSPICHGCQPANGTVCCDLSLILLPLHRTETLGGEAEPCSSRRANSDKHTHKQTFHSVTRF